MPKDQAVGRFRVPDDARPALCKSCRAPIVWVTTARGTPMPITASSIETDDKGDHYGTTHFADCPNANSHRRR